MKPVFFGTRDRQLFGVHHAPRGRAQRSVAVVLCAPGVEESIGIQGTFRVLAQLLAREGFAVLRFDYFGTGDSGGATNDATFESFCADIATAAAELRDIAAVRRIGAIGLRLGAVAALSAYEGARLSELVLWEPVASGEAYLAEMTEAQERKFRTWPRPIVRPTSTRKDHHRLGELLGFTLSEKREASLRAARLSVAPPGESGRNKRERLFLASRLGEATLPTLRALLSSQAHRVETIEIDSELPIDGPLSPPSPRTLSAMTQHLAQYWI